MDEQCNYLSPASRRAFFQHSGFGLSSLALLGLLQNESASAGPQPHFKPRAKRVIYLHMIGAPSQLDLYDHKPELVKRNGEPCPESLLEGKRFAFLGAEKRLAGTKFKFAQHGESGQQFSELLPNLAKVADDIA